MAQMAFVSPRLHIDDLCIKQQRKSRGWLFHLHDGGVFGAWNANFWNQGQEWNNFKTPPSPSPCKLERHKTFENCGFTALLAPARIEEEAELQRRRSRSTTKKTCHDVCRSQSRTRKWLKSYAFIRSKVQARSQRFDITKSSSKSVSNNQAWVGNGGQIGRCTMGGIQGRSQEANHEDVDVTGEETWVHGRMTGIWDAWNRMTRVHDDGYEMKNNKWL